MLSRLEDLDRRIRTFLATVIEQEQRTGFPMTAAIAFAIRYGCSLACEYFLIETADLFSFSTNLCWTGCGLLSRFPRIEPGTLPEQL